MTDLWRRLGALALLAGFLVQAGDGLAVTLCHGAMDHGQEVTHLHDDQPAPTSSHHHDPSHEERPTPPGPEAPTGEEPCPFGSGAILVCSAATTTAPPAELIRLPVAPIVAGAVPSFEDSMGALLAHETFRPPRA